MRQYFFLEKLLISYCGGSTGCRAAFLIKVEQGTDTGKRGHAAYYHQPVPQRGKGCKCFGSHY